MAEKKAKTEGKETPVSKEDKKKQEGKAAEIIEVIKELSVIELSELIKALEEEFGVSASVPMAVAAPAAQAAGSAAAADAEEKTSFSVILAAVGEKKIQVIKEVRAVTNLGLKEAKDLVDGAPKPVKEGIPPEEAEEVKKKLESAGATVEIK